MTLIPARLPALLASGVDDRLLLFAVAALLWQNGADKWLIIALLYAAM